MLADRYQDHSMNAAHCSDSIVRLEQVCSFYPT